MLQTTRKTAVLFGETMALTPYKRTRAFILISTKLFSIECRQDNFQRKEFHSTKLPETNLRYAASHRERKFNDRSLNVFQVFSFMLFEIS